MTAAAERQHLSTPAMSHTLARIREAFGAPILVGAVRAGHAALEVKRGKTAMTAQRFAAARHVGITLRRGEVSVVDQALANLGLERHVALLVPSTFSALIAASRSDLVACTPERTARSMAPSLGLTLFDLPVTARTEPMRLAWHPRHGADPAHRWLRECIQRVLDNPQWKTPSVTSLTRKAKKEDR